MAGPIGTVAVVLPPRENFSPQASGAVALMVHRLASAPTRFDVAVIGSPVTGQPFPGVVYRPVRPGWLPGGRTTRYAAAVARLLRPSPPALIEVHNRPDVALPLARAFPTSRVSLFLHNDPQGMRHAGTAGERASLLRRLAGVVSVSDYVRQRLLDGVSHPPGCVRVLPNCLDLAALPPALPPEQRDRTVLFAGRIVADKGADSFVAAWALARAALPGWRADMIGADRFRPDSPETPFLQALRPRAAGAGVHLLGYRPHAAVLAAMSRAAIVVVPSRWQEPFGLTALEAMACGAALVCAPRGGLPELVGDGALWVDPDDPAAIAAAICALAADPDRLASLARAGLARAARFDRPAAALALDAYRETFMMDREQGQGPA